VHLHQHLLHAVRCGRHRCARREEARDSPGREHARRPDLPQEGRRMHRGVLWRTCDDGEPSLSREPHAREGRRDTGRARVMKDYPQNLVCFTTFGSEEPWTLATYEKHDGYKAWRRVLAGDRKSTRLNSSHVKISYAVFCLKKKKQKLLKR